MAVEGFLFRTHHGEAVFGGCFNQAVKPEPEFFCASEVFEVYVTAIVAIRIGRPGSEPVSQVHVFNISGSKGKGERILIELRTVATVRG